MANLIIKSSADNLVLQGSDASPAITVGATGTTTFAENATLSGTGNNLGTVTAGVWSGTPIATVKGGGVRQIVQNTTTTESDGTFNTTARVITDLNVAITPAATTSRIMVTFSCGGMANNICDSIKLTMKRAITGGATTEIRVQNRYEYMSNGTGWQGLAIYSHYLDSPSTTSLCTYSLWLTSETARTYEINPELGTNCGVVTAIEYAAN